MSEGCRGRALERGVLTSFSRQCRTGPASRGGGGGVRTSLSKETYSHLRFSKEVRTPAHPSENDPFYLPTRLHVNLNDMQSDLILCLINGFYTRMLMACRLMNEWPDKGLRLSV